MNSDRFNIEFGLQNGTTYNSYLIRGEQTVLIDTSHQKLALQFLEGFVCDRFSKRVGKSGFSIKTGFLSNF
ncbi:hypothetical protein [Nostoc sp. NOS(2021)]|uniref:hypothetical protein n=1 Tax=Nostoc sp. NOS(2021) TaxID=2815407 RepID=UPI0025ECF6F4|nr:hypothetical protein [Nostoc sp. NOS(2021)]